MLNRLNEDFVKNEMPRTTNDERLLEQYRQRLSRCDMTSLKRQLQDAATMNEELFIPFPVHEERREGQIDVPVLTGYGFASLILDRDFMRDIFIPSCLILKNRKLPDDFFNPQCLNLLRSSLTEFAILGCMEAQSLLFGLGNKPGADDSLIQDIVEHRWPNLQNLNRFVVAHQGAGRGVNADDVVSSYETAMAEVRAGAKRTGWIWYVFPQMYGIKGTHSAPSLYYGIRGRIEAFQYICHPVLRQHLVEISQALLDSRYSVYEIFGNDTMKVRSCINLFATVTEIPVFKELQKRNHWL